MENEKGGVKNSDGKPKCYLIDPEFILGLARVLTFGANKYPQPDNWKKVEPNEYISATYRHLAAYHSGERYDQETGESHLYHIACCLQFLDWFDRQNDKKAKTKEVKPGLFEIDISEVIKKMGLENEEKFKSIP